MGTPNYMSPEQVRGERAGPPSDVFSLGAVFYEVIGGRRAFDADSMHAVLYKVTDSDPIPLAECCPDLPPIIEIFVSEGAGQGPRAPLPRRKRDARGPRAVPPGPRRLARGSGGHRLLARGPDHDPAAQRSGRPRRRGSNRPTSAAGTTPVAASRRIRPVGLAASMPGTTVLASLGPKGSEDRLETAGGTRQRRRGPTPPSRPAIRPAPSRAPLYIGATAVAVLIAAGALVAPEAPAGSRAPAPEDRQAKALVSVAVEAQLDAARRSLEFKDLEGAIAAAGKALQLDPGQRRGPGHRRDAPALRSTRSRPGARGARGGGRPATWTGPARRSRRCSPSCRSTPWPANCRRSSPAASRRRRTRRRRRWLARPRPHAAPAPALFAPTRKRPRWPGARNRRTARSSTPRRRSSSAKPSAPTRSRGATPSTRREADAAAGHDPPWSAADDLRSRGAHQRPRTAPDAGSAAPPPIVAATPPATPLPKTDAERRGGGAPARRQPQACDRGEGPGALQESCGPA